MPKTNNQNLVNFFFELGLLKRQKCTGATLAGYDNPDSLAEHTVRAAIIAFILASEEGADPYKVATICLIHDLPEMRTGDRHKVNARYYPDVKLSERKALLEQLNSLPKDVAKVWLDLYDQNDKRNTREGVVAKDADWLEMALTARELVVRGYTGMQDWINNVKAALETNTAKEWVKLIDKSDPNAWWRGLKKMTYKKLKK